MKKRVFLLVAVILLVLFGFALGARAQCSADDYENTTAIWGGVDYKSGCCRIDNTLAEIGVNYPEPKTIEVIDPRTKVSRGTITYFPGNYSIDHCCRVSAHIFDLCDGGAKRPDYTVKSVVVPEGLDEPQFNFTVPAQVCGRPWELRCSDRCGGRRCRADAWVALPEFQVEAYILECAEDIDCPGYPGAYCDYFSSDDPLDWACIDIEEGEMRQNNTVIWHEGEWKHAGDYEFAIITINDTDYISNWRKWYKCGEDFSNGEVLEGYGEKSIDALKFLCYEQGGKNLIAECCISAGPGEDYNIHNIGCYNDGYKENIESTVYDNSEKLRFIGEPLTLFGDEQTLDFEWSTPGIDVGYKSIQIIDLATPINDWSGYDYLEFFVELINEKEYYIKLMSGPDDLFGYSLEEDYTEEFNGSLADYVAGSYNEAMHVAIPIGDINDATNISQIIFYTDVTQFEPDETASVYLNRFFLSNADITYCTDSYVTSWTDDLDVEYEPEFRSRQACDSFSAYKWTGTQCCGDDYDTDEFYKDDLAGCWYSNVVENDSTVVGNTVLFYNGEYYGCNAEGAVDYEAVSCEAIGSYFCDPGVGWNDEFSGTDASLRSNESSVPDEVAGLVPEAASCCAPNYCWNGTECIIGIENMPEEVYNLSGYTYRCVYGEWQPAVLKFDWDNVENGYCPYVEQCLVDKNGNTSQDYDASKYHPDNPPLCIDDGESIEDHYCDNGEWTTRTRLIALSLLDVETISDDFILYCDHYKRSLADYTYEPVEDYLAGPERGTYPALKRKCFEGYDVDCVNHFCVLKYEDNDGIKTGFGVSLNRPIDDVEYSFLEALNFERIYCDSLSGSGPYFKCSSENDIWYNPELNAVIYGRDGIDVSEEQTVVGSIADFFKTVFGWILGWKPSQPAGTAIDVSLINETKNYDTLYLQKQGDKEVYAIMEMIGENVLITVDYVNFDSDICAAVNRMAKYDPYQATQCNATEGHYVVYGNYAGIWQELTSKLRIN